MDDNCENCCCTDERAHNCVKDLVVHKGYSKRVYYNVMNAFYAHTAWYTNACFTRQIYEKRIHSPIRTAPKLIPEEGSPPGFDII